MIGFQLFHLTAFLHLKNALHRYHLFSGCKIIFFSSFHRVLAIMRVLYFALCILMVIVPSAQVKILLM
ncbi:unnamed protein product [Haemonchus placei]|uniref:7TM_GPCR_Srx domain-containing protein n=1 Tax=Haemonchus placei TaxID=6290 RepID=A0A0N4WY53_HAEPC|nr:unnamed protein product [Haemonchus placei]